MEALEAGVLVFFVLALTSVLKLRNQIRSFNPESYNAIAGGLALLALSAMARTYHSLGLFDDLPFLSVTLFYELTLWILAIAGAAMMVSGVSTWLPLARKHYRYSEARLRRLELLKHIEQLVGVENRLDAILDRSCQHIVDHFGLAGGMVFKYSDRRKRLVYVSGTSWPKVDPASLGSLTLDDSRLGLLLGGEPYDNGKILQSRPTDMPRPWRVMPMLIRGRFVGFYALWASKEKRFVNDDEMTLRLAIDIVVRKIEQDRMTLQLNSTFAKCDLQKRIAHIIHEAEDVKEAFSGCVAAIRKVASADYAAFSILDSRGGILRRYSCGKDTGVLVEASMARPSASAPSAQTFMLARSTVVALAPGKQRLESSELLAATTAQSMAAFPVAAGGIPKGVLLVASDQPSAYSGSTMSILQQATEQMVALIDKDAHGNLAESHSRRTQRVASILAGAIRQTQDQICRAAAQLIADETDADAVRITTVEDRGSFLKSRAFVYRHDAMGSAPQSGSLITSLLPLHGEVLKSGESRLELAVDRDSGDERLEMRQVFGMQPSATLLTPIIVDRTTIGVLAVAQDTATPAFTSNETRQFADLVAAVISIAMRRGESERPLQQRQVKQRESEDMSRLKSWLTGVLGSVELMNTKHDAIEDQELLKYMDTLNKSARRISDYLREDRAVEV